MARPKNKQEYIKNLKTIYASFEIKDLTQGEFIRQMSDLHNPNKIVSDLGDVELKCAREKLNRMRINKAILEN